MNRAITAAVIPILLFVYAIAGMVLYQSRRQYERQATLTVQNLTHPIAANVAGVFEKIDVGLFALANSVARQLAAGGVNAPT